MHSRHHITRRLLLSATPVRTFPSSSSLLASSLRNFVRSSRTATSTAARFSPNRFFSSSPSSVPVVTRPSYYIPLHIPPPSTMSGLSAVARLRALMKTNSIAAYIIPTADAHQSEYVAGADARRAFITGFTGSAGVAVVLAEPFTAQLDATYGPPQVCGRLFTDGRYYLQAANELNAAEFTLMKAGQVETPKMEDWLLKVLPAGSNVGIDPAITSISAFKTLKSTLKDTLNIVFTEKNLVDEVWGAARPAYSPNPLMILAEEWTGESSASKLARIRAKMASNDSTLLIVTALDEIAWLFNLRGSDIPFNPVFMSYAIVTPDSATLYIDTAKVTDAVKAHLGASVTCKPYSSMFAELKAHVSGGSVSKTKKVWMDPSRCNTAIYNIVPADFVVELENPIQLMKAIKNEVEVKGMRNAHIKDAAAVINFLAWIENELLVKKNTSLTECSVADRLEAFRAEQKDFVGLSFDTISSSGPNGSVIHYKPEPETCRKIAVEEMFLLDSGAQFKDGTTDITRTMHYGQPSAFQIESFTRVLKGHIGLALAVFPPTTVGPTIDILARQALWKVGLDYVHGTGHGVGAFLNVHEGPCGISSTTRSHSVLTTPLASGMILSNEPGYYQDGEFGIRIESLCVVRPKQTQYRFLDKQYLGFDTITLVPIQRSLIDVALLSDDELQWLNAYHAEVREKISDRVNELAKPWLLKQTEKITRQ